jgi:hypothetical protein
VLFTLATRTGGVLGRLFIINVQLSSDNFALRLEKVALHVLYQGIVNVQKYLPVDKLMQREHCWVLLEQRREV